MIAANDAVATATYLPQLPPPKAAAAPPAPSLPPAHGPLHASEHVGSADAKGAAKRAQKEERQRAAAAKLETERLRTASLRQLGGMQLQHCLERLQLAGVAELLDGFARYEALQLGEAPPPPIDLTRHVVPYHTRSAFGVIEAMHFPAQYLHGKAIDRQYEQ